MPRLIIETDKLKKNIDIIKGLTTANIIAVVKGNGYGLGVLEYASFLLENGIVLFAVSDIKDAVLLTENGFVGNILLLTPPCSQEEANIIVANQIISSIGSISSALLINEAALELDVIAKAHIKIDTGFGRFGFLSPENKDKPASTEPASSGNINHIIHINDACELLNKLTNIEFAGTYTHLSFSFSNKPLHIKSQYNSFMKSVETMRQKGLTTGMLHICNSSAFLRYPEMHLDAVRIGSAFLGRIPIENVYGLQKIGYLISRVIEIKNLPPKHNIGYANTYTTKKPTTIGIVPVGYKHGFGLEKSRDTFRFIDILRYVYKDIKSLNKKIYVEINGNLVPVLGRVSMYHIMVDLSSINANIGDPVRLSINTLHVASQVEREYCFSPTKSVPTS